MTFICINCYDEISDSCNHFTLNRKQLSVDDTCRYSRNNKTGSFVDITCSCGIKTELQLPSGWKMYICTCGNFLSYSLWTEVINLNRIHEITRVPFPSCKCTICNGSGDRLICTFSRCENCDGTGGIKPSNICVVCKGNGASVKGQTVIKCNHVKY